MTVLPGFSDKLFDGVRVVVTGAAGGIGSAIAQAFDACGAELWLVDHDDAALQAMQGRLRRSCAHVCDLSDRSEIYRIAKTVCANGPLDVLVNCAGVFARVPVGDARAERTWDLTLAVNLTAPYLLTCACLPALEQARGAVVNITSVRAQTSAARASAYTAAKAGLTGVTIALADECAPSGVRVNAVAPGEVDTAMGHNDAGISEALFARTPIKRMAQPAEVAAAVVFLASPLSAYTTGATLTVDGGFLIT